MTQPQDHMGIKDITKALKTLVPSGNTAVNGSN